MIYKRGGWYWTDFTENGRRYRRALKTKDWQKARTEERNVIELARAGKLADSAAPKQLFEAAQRYLDDKAVRCSPRTHELETERLSMVKKFFGDIRISAITPGAIQRYQQERKKNGTANRTINMDVGALSRVLKHFGLWRTIEERVKQLPETASADWPCFGLRRTAQTPGSCQQQSRVGACLSRGSCGCEYLPPAS